MESGGIKLSREALDEFKAIYEAEFDEKLTDERAKETALRVLRFFRILTRPPAGPSR